MATQTIPPGGAKLREWRQRKKLTLAQVGEILGCTHVHVSNIERGVDGPSLQLAEAIRRMTGGRVPTSSWVVIPEAQPVEEVA